jgi:hypothetical protein
VEIPRQQCRQRKVSVLPRNRNQLAKPPNRMAFIKSQMEENSR